MAHEKKFKGIPMSKSMRGLCKEEDYAFLEMSEKTEGAGVLEENQRDNKEDKEERISWRQQREQKERERLREIEESRKEKEQQWRTHVATLTSSQEKTLQDRLARLKRFREFQRKVLVEESGMEASTAILTANQLLTRM